MALRLNQVFTWFCQRRINLQIRYNFRQMVKSIHEISTIIIDFGKRPIADFFHDQTICIADCKNLTIGHSLSPDAYLGSTVHYTCAKTAIDPGFWSRELWVC